MKNSVLTLLIVVLFSVHITSQVITDSIGNFLIMPGDEIPSNQHFNIVSDNKGNIYAGSYVGLSIWNGNEWNLFKPEDSYGIHRVDAIAIDTSSAVWLASGQHLVQYKNGIGKEFKYPVYKYNYYDVVVSKNNEVYTNVSKKVLKIDPLTFNSTEIDIGNNETLWSMQFDNKGAIWGQSSNGNRFYEIRNDSVFSHSHLNGISSSNINEFCIIDTNFCAIITDNNMQLYRNGEYQNIDPPFTDDYWVSHFKFLPDSTLLLACEMGAFAFKNGHWKKFGELNYARDICQISTDSFAIAYEYDGISIGTIVNLTNYKGPTLDRTYAMEWYNSQMFLGSWKGYVSQWDGSKITTTGIKPLFYGCFDLCVSPDNMLYCSGRNGVYRYYNTQWESLNALYNLPDDVYVQCDVDSNSRLYVGTENNGLYVADSTGIINRYFTHNSPLNKLSGGILYDSKDRLWAGSYDDFYAYGQLYMLENNVFTKFDIPNCTGLPKKILEDRQGNIWVGCIGTLVDSCSLARFDGLNWDTLHYETEYDWRNYEDVWDMYEDIKGGIWIATSHAAYLYDGNHWYKYGKNMGIGKADIGTTAINGDPLGNIYIATNTTGTYVVSYYTAISDKKARKLQNLIIYPNPTSGEINLNWQYKGESSVAVYDQVGKLVFSQKTDGPNPTINLSNLAKGQYIINITTDEAFGSSTVILK